MMKAGLIDEMIADAMDSAMGGEELEDDVEAEIEKVRAWFRLQVYAGGQAC
jgi:charged multivesicular body protein 3